MKNEVLDYLRNRDALVQLKEQESSLPDSYGDSWGWVLYCLWALPISAIIVIGGPIAGPSIAIFVIIYIINGWLKDGEKLVKEEEAARFGIKKRKRAFSKINDKGEGVAHDEVQAFSWYCKAAEQGLADAQFNLGICYYKGEGVAKDFVQAVSWWRKAAEQGHTDAQFKLGNIYRTGEGVAKDFVQAVSWYRKAAEQGLALAQYNLGVCYANGEGVAKDEIEVYAYWNLAGITDESARKNLAILEKKMSRDEIASGQQRTKELQKEIEAKIAAKKAGK